MAGHEPERALAVSAPWVQAASRSLSWLAGRAREHRPAFSHGGQFVRSLCRWLSLATGWQAAELQGRVEPVVSLSLSMYLSISLSRSASYPAITLQESTP